MGFSKSVVVTAVAAGLIGGLGSAPAGAADSGRLRESYVAMAGAQAAGPAADQRVHVLEVGPARARQVVVLVPGMFGAAGGLEALARELAERLPDTQVWAVDRRDQDLADLRGFRLPPDQAAAYYLGGQYRAQTAQSAPFAGRWGLERPAGGSAEGGAGGRRPRAAEGRARRALVGRDDRLGVRGLGLRRPSRLPGSRGSGAHRRRRA